MYRYSVWCLCGKSTTQNPKGLVLCSFCIGNKIPQLTCAATATSTTAAAAIVNLIIVMLQYCFAFVDSRFGKLLKLMFYVDITYTMYIIHMYISFSH